MRTSVAFVIAGLAATTASASDFTASLYGVIAPTTIKYESTHTFEAFAEQASLAAAYEARTGYGFEAGLTWNFTRSLGVGLAGGLVTRDTDATYDARVPNPLFLRRDREAEGAPGSLDYKEGQLHLDLVYSGRSGSWDFTAFAGPSFFSVEAQLLGEPQFEQSYPFLTITISSVPAISSDDTGFGFNVGAGVAYRFNERIGFGLQGRFSRATVELVPAGQDPVQIDAGGFQIAGGLRIYF